MITKQSAHLFLSLSAFIGLFTGLLPVDRRCYGDDHVPIDSVQQLAIERASTSTLATFTHKLRLERGSKYRLPVAITTGDENAFLQSLQVTHADEAVRNYSYHLVEEELGPQVSEQLPGVLDADNFDEAAFRRRLLGQEVTVEYRQSPSPADPTPQPNAENLGQTASTDEPTSVPVQVTGQLLGISPDTHAIKLLVSDDSGGQVIEIARDTIISLRFGKEAVSGLALAIQLQRERAAPVKHLILTPGKTIDEAVITYRYALANMIEVELAGELPAGDGTMEITGWVKLRNATPFDWKRTTVTLVAADKTDADHVLGDISLKRGRLTRISLPPPNGKGWKVGVSSRYLVGQVVQDGTSHPPVNRELTLNNCTDVSIPAGHLYLYQAGILQRDADVLKDLNPNKEWKVSIGTNAIRVKAERHSELLVKEVALCPANGFLICGHSGRQTTYAIDQGANDSIPVDLARSDKDTYSLEENKAQYTFRCGKDDLIRVKKGVNTVRLVEYRIDGQPKAGSVIDIPNVADVGGLQWLLDRTASDSARKHLQQASDIRTEIDGILEEINDLESQLSDLQGRREKYLSDQQSRNHGAIIRRMADHIYRKEMQLEDKRAELVILEHRLDRLALSAMNGDES